jgi:hypothetical protein
MPSREGQQMHFLYPPPFICCMASTLIRQIKNFYFSQRYLFPRSKAKCVPLFPDGTMMFALGIELTVTPPAMILVLSLGGIA